MNKDKLKLYKAKKIRDTYKTILLETKQGHKKPYFENWLQRLLKIEYLIIELRYSTKHYTTV